MVPTTLTARSSSRLVCAATLAFASGAALAQPAQVVGGQTSVVLDFDTLASAASLEFSSVSPDVIAPGSLDGSVAFGINSRSAGAPLIPTTFAYDASDPLGTLSGSIEHAGSVFFNSDTVEVGNFTIGFDAARAGGDRSGFFVESTAGLPAILFDVAAPAALTATTSVFSVEADLLVSAEFGQFLLDNQLASANLSGATVGRALVEGTVIPAPGAAAALGLMGLTATRRRR